MEEKSCVYVERNGNEKKNYDLFRCFKVTFLRWIFPIDNLWRLHSQLDMTLDLHIYESFFFSAWKLLPNMIHIFHYPIKLSENIFVFIHNSNVHSFFITRTICLFVFPSVNRSLIYWMNRFYVVLKHWLISKLPYVKRFFANLFSLWFHPFPTLTDSLSFACSYDNKWLLFAFENLMPLTILKARMRITTPNLSFLSFSSLSWL